MNLPNEILASVFSFLSPAELYPCLVVSHQWSLAAQPWLYRHADLRSETTPDMIMAFKQHQGCIRSALWIELHNPALPIPEADVLDILLDWRPSSIGPPDPDLVDLFDPELKAMIKPGPNRPPLQSLTFLGVTKPLDYFPVCLSHLQTLVRLEIHCLQLSYYVRGNSMALDTILLSLPELRHLLIDGSDYIPIPEDSPIYDKDQPSFKLQHFQFQMVALLGKHSHQAVFTRMSNLVSIRFNIPDAGWLPKIFMKGYVDHRFATFLQEYCPRIQTVQYDGMVPLPLKFQPELGKSQREQKSWVAFPSMTSFTSSQYTFSALDLSFLAQLNQLTVLDLENPGISGLQLQEFLETCHHLKTLRVVGTSLLWIDMIPSGARISDYSASSNDFLCYREAKPWPFEDTIESLALSFSIPSAHPIDHRIIYGRLARLMKLRSLSFVKSGLIPTLSHGIDLLVDLRRLETICWSNSLWPMPDKETTQWLATSFSRLRSLAVLLRKGSRLADEFQGWLEEVAEAGTVAKFE